MGPGASGKLRVWVDGEPGRSVPASLGAEDFLLVARQAYARAGAKLPRTDGGYDLRKSGDLEPDEPAPTADTTCPHCGAQASLGETAFARYTGAPEQTTRHLGAIERSGKQAQQLVFSVRGAARLKRAPRA